MNGLGSGPCTERQPAVAGELRRPEIHGEEGVQTDQFCGETLLLRPSSEFAEVDAHLGVVELNGFLWGLIEGAELGEQSGAAGGQDAGHLIDKLPAPDVVPAVLSGLGTEICEHLIGHEKIDTGVLEGEANRVAEDGEGLGCPSRLCAEKARRKVDTKIGSLGVWPRCGNGPCSTADLDDEAGGCAERFEEGFAIGAMGQPRMGDLHGVGDRGLSIVELSLGIDDVVSMVGAQ
jgi:hypothetical protein